MDEGVSSLNRPAPISSVARSNSADSVDEDGKVKRRFTRTAQRGEVNRVLERMNSQSAILSGTASNFKTSNAQSRRSNRLSLTDHGDFNQSSRLLSQSAHVGNSRARKPLLERLDSEPSVASGGSFGEDSEGAEKEDEEEKPEKPASFRPRPNLRSTNAANRVLGRMESKRTLTDLIEDTQTRSRPMRTSSGMSASSSSKTEEPMKSRPSRPMRSRSIEEIDEQIFKLEQKQEKGTSDHKEGATKDAARRVLGRMESKRTLTDLISETNARSGPSNSRPTRTRPTLADLGIPERSRPSRTRSDTNGTPDIPSRRRPTRASSTTDTPEASPNARRPASSRRASMEPVMSPYKEQAEQEAYELERDAERKRLEAMELLRQAEEAEEEAHRKMAEVAAAAESESVSEPTLDPVVPTPKMTVLEKPAFLSRSSEVSAITVEDEGEVDGSDSSGDDDDDAESSVSSEDGSSNDDDDGSTAASEAHSDSSSDVYLDETERSEEVVLMPAEDAEKTKLVSKTQRLRQLENSDQHDGHRGLAEEGDHSGDEEEIQRRADERRRLRESGHLDIMSPARVKGLNIHSGYVGLGSNSSALGSGKVSEDEASNDASNGDDSIRRRARDRRIRELEEKATTSLSSFGSEVLGADSGDESGSQFDADKARRKAERLERRSKRITIGVEQPPIQSPEEKSQRKAQREKEIEKRKAELEARRAEAQKRKEERRRLLGVRDVQ
ncbi:unnamed protein product [Cylindrotheca closterium]|uniref:Uncharacterized protein n=1 Tax=Cylindrotheca closterium TaxID=2856 RepID=A0AAD2CPZ9_9STRA|nr:unnamed protein product [Cylindrotheca closterium]